LLSFACHALAPRSERTFPFKVAIIIRNALAPRSLIVAVKGVIMTTGTVKWFNSTKGFGFIQPDNGCAGAFVHMSAVERACSRELVEGQKIGFELERDNKSGKMSACNLQAA